MTTDDGLTRVTINIGLYCAISYTLDVENHKTEHIEVTYKGRRIDGVNTIAFIAGPCGFASTSVARFVIEKREGVEIDTDFINFLKEEGISYYVMKP